jgi:thermitase
VFRRWSRVVALIVACVLSVPVLSAPALANEGRDAHTFVVTRGGQTFQRTTFQTEVAPDGRLMRAGSFIVRFRPLTGIFERDLAHRLAGAIGTEPLLSSTSVRVQVGRGRTLAAWLAYGRDRAVESVEPDYVAHALLTPNDPRFAEQWGHTKIRAGSPGGSADPSAWDVSTSSAGTRVAILDCGVYNEGSSNYIAPDGGRGHPDLRGKVIGNRNFTTAPDADDYCNHGTHVAGTAAANTNNGVGVAGVGHLASVLNVKVLGDNGSGSFSWIINGILYAAGCETDPCGTRRAEIINMSLGATGDCTTSLQDAINKAWAQGVVVVAASGNSGASGAITPANCERVIGVAASDQNDAKASFSNFGSGVDVAAPGTSILSTNYVGGYSSFSGTSMASPHVAGLAALVWTTAHNTGGQAVADRITCTANEGALAGSTHGRVDAYAAVVPGACVAPLPPATLAIDDVAANEGNSGTTALTFTVTRSGDVDRAVSVAFATSTGSAAAGNDYVSASGTLSFAAGEIAKPITVLVNGDTAVEPSETFNVDLSSATNATISDARGVGTIRNDDLPTLSISDESLNERNNGTRTYSFAVRLSPSSAQTVTVAYATANGTAIGGSTCGPGVDYQSGSGTLSFSPGATSRTISVTGCGDRAVEPDETFFIVISNAVNAAINDPQGVGTIRNDDD